MKDSPKRLIMPFALAATAGLTYGLLLRPWHLRWGATDEEAREVLPGEETVPSPNEMTTHAITIYARADAVWPWLVQIGQTRGGFYSYTWLENIVGCHMHNADRIIPEFQHIAVGDNVWLHPKAPPLPVVYVEREKALVLGSNTSMPGIWGMYLKPINRDTTRLIVRGRSCILPNLTSWIGHYLLFEPAHFIMERKMLLGIKVRAEAYNRCR